MKKSLIVAMGKNREIGKNNDLLWHLPKDMQFFKRTTEGHIVVMGRKNWDSIPLRFRPLANRENIVLTRNGNLELEGAKVFTNLNDIYTTFASDERICFIIGGAQVYQLALEKNDIDELYITHVDESFDADTFFPELDLSAWKSEELFKQEKDEKHPYSFVVKRYWR
jgi:dihydrofolate reductase